MATTNDKDPSEFKNPYVTNDCHTDAALPVADLTTTTYLQAGYMMSWDTTDKTLIDYSPDASQHTAGILVKSQEIRVNQTLDENTRLTFIREGETWGYAYVAILKDDLLVTGPGGTLRPFLAISDDPYAICAKALCDASANGDKVRIWKFMWGGVTY